MYEEEYEGENPFEVVGEGYDDYDDEGEEEYELVEGSILGDESVLGAARNPYAAFIQRLRAAGRHHPAHHPAHHHVRHGHPVVHAPRPHHAPRLMRVHRKPRWRSQLAPGVIQPGEGMIPLPLTPTSAGGTFSATANQITFQGQLQKPYRPERLLVSVVRTGTTATGRLLAQLFVGTDLQQADITGFDIEVFGAATAFGTRLTCKAAQPGVLIRLIVTITTAPQNADTVFASCQFAGRVIH